jgi:hypothetical protein
VQLFFGVLALTMLGVKYKGDKRDQYLQHGGWFVKIALWVICNILPFLLPAGIVNSYGEHPIFFPQDSPLARGSSVPPLPAPQLGLGSCFFVQFAFS